MPNNSFKIKVKFMLILSQNSNLSLIIRTMSDKPKFRDNPQNIWPVSSKVWVEKKKKRKKED